MGCYLTLTLTLTLTKGLNLSRGRAGVERLAVELLLDEIKALVATDERIDHAGRFLGSYLLASSALSSATSHRSICNL